MDLAGMRRKDTTKGPPLRILSLDGGGVRGYSMLIILQELMHRTFVEIEGKAPRRREIPKPCDHFDLIIGTGTGGLIALMLGRLRLDIETCKNVYVRMTKRVFETDKTIAGIPYRSTLFKASKLEEAIMECVREYTRHEDDGTDGGYGLGAELDIPRSPVSMRPVSNYSEGPTRSMSVASRYSQIGNTPSHRGSQGHGRWGNPHALLYDARENRTKTAVTAIFKGTRRDGKPILLRSYDSRKETAPEEQCTIWQAGRATCATALAFKPIEIGQSIFLDEGAGKYNPAPFALEEAVVNEWPGREIGVFVSVGTGKRPKNSDAQQHLWWEGFISSGLGDFAEARRRLIAKIEGCEQTHKDMLHKHLADRGVNPENYYRFNVDVGVGEFGMNEWGRLADISTNTRTYLASDAVQHKNISCASKLARIKRQSLRWNRALHAGQQVDTSEPRLSWEYQESVEPEPPSVPGAIELPAEDVVVPVPAGPATPPPRRRYGSPAPNDSATRPPPQQPPQQQQQQHLRTADDDKFIVHAPEPNSQPHSHSHSPHRSHSPSPRRSGDHRHEQSSAPLPPITANTPPPIPPKTPIPGQARPVPPSASTQQPPHPPPPPPGMQSHLSQPPAGVVLPYPDTDGPPPVVNMARKPEFGR